MELTNLNLLTFLIFISILWFILFLSYKFYFNQLKFNKEFNLIKTSKYFYIKYIFLLVSLFIVLFWIFWVKFWDKHIKSNAKWIDMMFVVDVSKSMNVADITDSNYAYTRLDVIKDNISKYVSSHREDRFWLTIFAWDAISTIPLTTDHDLFLTILSWVDYRNLTKQWSDFKKALELWINRFNTSDDRSKALVFISDWGDADDNINKNEIEKLVSNVKWITYLVVWVWTNKWWRIITWRDVFWRSSYQRYKWEYVISKINKNNLRDISSALNWEYFEVSNVSDLQKLDKYTSSLEKKVYEKSVNWELWDFWRSLSIISFISFMIFILLYLFEDKIYNLNLNNYVKTNK